MNQATCSAPPLPPADLLGTDWFDPLEDAVRGRVRALIERLLEEELEAALGRSGEVLRLLGIQGGVHPLGG